MQFTVLQHFDFVGDFLNYTFWTHCPNAFHEDKERYAFYNSVRYGICTNLFSKEELLSSIKKAQVEKRTENSLVELVSEIRHD